MKLDTIIALILQMTFTQLVSGEEDSNPHGPAPGPVPALPVILTGSPGWESLS